VYDTCGFVAWICGLCAGRAHGSNHSDKRTLRDELGRHRNRALGVGAAVVACAQLDIMPLDARPKLPRGKLGRRDEVRAQRLGIACQVRRDPDD
jgi:hypothetical protein